MRILRKSIPFLCILLLFGLGISLPNIGAWLIDHQLEQEVTTQEDHMDALALSQPLSLTETLLLMAGSRTAIEVEDNYKMTPEEVAKSVADALMELESVGIVMPAANNMEMTPMLLTSKTETGLSGIFWHCTWKDSDVEENSIWLDDMTGLMVAFRGNVGETELIPEQVGLTLVKFCERYYELFLEAIDLSVIDTVGILESTDQPSFSITYNMGDGMLSFNFNN